jgi:hypothetical protein
VGTLLGAVRRTTLRQEDLELDSLRTFWVSRLERSHEPDSGRQVTRRQIWPFYRRVEVLPRDAPPTGSFQAPWILPVGGEGWLRHIQGLLTFYEHRWERGEERMDWLFGLARSRRAPGYRLDALSWVYRHEAELSKRRLRILGIPFEWEAAPPSVLPTLHAADAD